MSIEVSWITLILALRRLISLGIWVKPVETMEFESGKEKTSIWKYENFKEDRFHWGVSAKLGYVTLFLHFQLILFFFYIWIFPGTL